MATLQSIGLNGIANTAPTPLSAVAINKYLVNDKLMNILEYTAEGVSDSLSNIRTSYMVYDSAGNEAVFRALGEEYTPDNAEPIIETVMLKPLGGSFNIDRINMIAFNNSPGSVSNFLEQQTVQKLNAITNGFAKAFIQGNSTTNSKSFDGLNKKITAGQITTAPITVEYSETGALKAEVEINKVIGKIKPGRPNLILTTATGAAILRSLNGYRHRGIEPIEVNSLKYDQFMGVPIVELTNDCWASTDLSAGIPLVFMLVDEVTGVRVSVPNGTTVIDILPPSFANGKVVQTGSCEMVSCPIFANPFAIAKCWLKEATVTKEASSSEK